MKKVKRFYKILSKIWKKPWALIVLILVIGGAMTYPIWGGGGDTDNFAVATRRDLMQEVNITGTVKPAQDLNLAFEQAGKLARVNVKTGQDVAAGQVLMSLENGDLYADLAQAQANFDVQKVKLSNSKKVGVVELENAKRDLVDQIYDAFTKTDNAIRNDADQLFTGVVPKYDNSIYKMDFNKRANVNTGRARIVGMLADWNRINLTLDSYQDIKVPAETVEGYLEFIQQFLNDLSDAVNDFPNDDNLNSYKTDVSTARTSVNTALTNFRGAFQDYLVAEADLSDAEAGVFDDVLIQEANVKDAEARVAGILAEINKTILRSPIDGVVANLDVEVGEITAANTEIISVISKGAFEVEANVPELQIVNIHEGDEVEVTLDAYGDDVIFDAVVVQIDPAAEIVGGIANYKTIILFKEADDRIRSGMTANIGITSEERQNVVAIPKGAIKSEAGELYVDVLVKEKPVRRPVEVGITGSGGFIEIISGVNEGEKVLLGES